MVNISFPLKHLLDSSKPLTTLKKDNVLWSVLTSGNLEQKTDQVYIETFMSTQAYPPVIFVFLCCQEATRLLALQIIFSTSHFSPHELILIISLQPNPQKQMTNRPTVSEKSRNYTREWSAWKKCSCLLNNRKG